MCIFEVYVDEFNVMWKLGVVFNYVAVAVSATGDGEVLDGEIYSEGGTF